MCAQSRAAVQSCNRRTWEGTEPADSSRPGRCALPQTTANSARTQAGSN